MGSGNVERQSVALQEGESAIHRLGELDKQHPKHWGTEISQLRGALKVSARKLSRISKTNRNTLRKMEQEGVGALGDFERVFKALGYEFELMLIQ